MDFESYVIFYNFFEVETYLLSFFYQFKHINLNGCNYAREPD